MSVRATILIVIIITAIIINVLALAVGSVFQTRNISSAMEADMLIAVDIADQYVTKEIELLKQKTGEVARIINVLYRVGGTASLLGADVLEHVRANHPDCIGLAVFNRAVLLDSWGEVSVPPDFINKPFMQTAIAGGSAVSTTMYSPNGMLVMYAATPINDGLVLAAVLPGLHFSNMLSRFNFWQSGHLFINDADGYVISSLRTEWVQQRINFIELTGTDHSYEDLAVIVQRGIAGETGTVRFSLDGEPRICAFRPVSSPTEGWFIGIIAPLNESILKNIPGSLLIMGMIVFILSIIAAIIAAAILKRPYEEADKMRKSAEAVSASKSTFLANVSHEIRTPMNSIVGFSELALDGEASVKTRDYLGKIKTNAEWLLQIVNDVLDISKVESGKLDFDNIPFNMHELFSSCRSLIIPKAVEKGLTLYFYVEPSIGKRPMGDPARLRQVLVNLLSNAVKFTNTGMIKLHAVLKNMREKDITMYFEVKDSGIGMTPEQIKKILNPLVQTDLAATRSYGADLGLNITKNIIELMGGKLSVESTLGIGSKFSFELVFDTIDADDEEILDSKIVFNMLEKPMFEGEILLCEDNSMNQQVICEHLTRVGFKTVVAENGKIGYEMVAKRMEKGEKQFDLIFMDMHMPVMDGLEASAKIMELNTGIPIVAITANIMLDDREIYKQNGMKDCVGKPFTSKELWRCLMKYFTPKVLGTEQKGTQIETEMEFQKNINLSFIKNNLKKYDEIAKALETGDITLAHRLAHSLKSNAGNIGKNILQKAAADVEYRLKGGKNNVTWEQLMILKTELEAVLNEFTPLLNESGSRTDRSFVLEPNAARELLEKLEPLLKSGNPDCMKFAGDLSAIQGSETLIQQMEDFNFEPALETLKELYKRMDA